MKITNTTARALKLPGGNGAPAKRLLAPGAHDVDARYFKAALESNRSLRTWVDLGWLVEGDLKPLAKAEPEGDEKPSKPPKPSKPKPE
jgi:hypothetical protein